MLDALWNVTADQVAAWKDAESRNIRDEAQRSDREAKEHARRVVATAKRDATRAQRDAGERDIAALHAIYSHHVMHGFGTFDEEPPKASEAMVAVNLLGVIRGVRLAAPGMRARGQGQIVTIASAASKLSPPGESTYAATKHGVLGYLTGVREELRGSAVTLSVIMPGVVETKLAEGTATGAAKLLQPDDVALAVVDIIEQPRFTLTIPGYVGPLVALVGLAPQRVRDQILRRMVPDQVAATRKG